MTVCAPSRASRKLRPVSYSVSALFWPASQDVKQAPVMSMRPPIALSEANPFGLLLSFNQRAVGALTSSAAPPSTSRFAPSSHSPAATSLSTFGLAMDRLNPAG
jgi:hypothetical protein